MESLIVEKLNIHSNPSEIHEWLERFELWCAINPAVKSVNKSAYFLTAGGSLSYDTLKTLLQQHLSSYNPEATERATFYSLIRLPNVRIRDFILQLEAQATKCNFGDQLSIQLRDRLIAGINDIELQRKLVLTPNISYSQACDICAQHEDENTVTSLDSDTSFGQCSRSSAVCSTPHKLQNPPQFAQNSPTVKCRNSVPSSSNVNCAHSRISTPSSPSMLNGDNPLMDDRDQVPNDLREAFALFDVNRDGRITASELESVLNFLGMRTTRAEVSQMIKDADCDGNGSVDFEEFLRMMRRYSQRERSKSPDAELREAFNVFDHNQDSVIDFEEIKRTMHFLGEAVTDAEVHEMIREADRDNDGKVDFEEFKYLMRLVRSRDGKC
ncbi:calmodulin-like protein 5 [Clonorchis sinensis]|uniref:Calmodulin-like protein 5 n=1 Tax=Clonorchis sinensis TaxID=79923 RepID=G7Y779_CLOSI|nr:calmodulin-like protein 5 [Clonorchis sinensis]